MNRRDFLRDSCLGLLTSSYLNKRFAFAKETWVDDYDDYLSADIPNLRPMELRHLYQMRSLKRIEYF